MTMKINDNGLDREMTLAEETAYLESAKIATAEAKINADKIAVKEAAQKAVLAKLGLSAEEAAALLG